MQDDSEDGRDRGHRHDGRDDHGAGHGRDGEERALEHLGEATRELGEIREVERLLEREVREAEVDLEHARETEIIVNGQPRVVPGHEVTFEEVVGLGFPGVSAQRNETFSVTFHRAARHPHSGELSPGRRVHVKKGSRFNVTRTVQS